MSDVIQNTDTPSPCDRLLDYVYGELAGDDLEQFKLHLLTCDKCKRELAGLERVRSAVKQAMPSVEPPVDKMAQLMHAAAQQKPKRGKVLMFVRRAVSHPAYAAAAVFVLVATAVTVNYSRNALEMPKEAMHEPVTAPPADVPAAPAAQPTTVKTEEAAAPAEAKPQVVLDGKDKAPTIALKSEPAGAYTVRKASPAKKISASDDEFVLEPTKSGYRAAEPAPANLRRDEGNAGKATHHASSNLAFDQTAEKQQVDRPATGTTTVPLPKPAAPAPARRTETRQSLNGALTNSGGAGNGDTLGGLGKGGEQGRMKNETETVAPGVVNQAPAKESSMSAQAQAPRAAATPPAAPPPPVAAPTAQAESPSFAESKGAKYDSNYKAPQQKSVDPVLQKKQFLSYVASNRCSEAVTLYQQLDKQYSNLFSTKENQEYVRCLRLVGQDELADRVQEVNAPRASKAKAKKAAPASAPAKPAAADSAK